MGDATVPVTEITTTATSPQHPSPGRQQQLGSFSAESTATDSYRQNLAMKLVLWGLQATAIWSSLLLTVRATGEDGLRFKVNGKRNPPNLKYNKRGNIIGSSTLSNSADISYYANVTLGGVSFSVLIGGCDPSLL